MKLFVFQQLGVILFGDHYDTNKRTSNFETFNPGRPDLNYYNHPVLTGYNFHIIPGFLAKEMRRKRKHKHP